MLWNTCITAVDCGPIPADTYVTPASTDYVRHYPAVVRMQCIPGYDLEDGSGVVRCQTDGQWSSLPVCKGQSVSASHSLRLSKSSRLDLLSLTVITAIFPEAGEPCLNYKPAGDILTIVR